MKLYALDGSKFDAVKVGADPRGCLNELDACCGCGMLAGDDHAPECDWEPCPRCGGQLGMCNCPDEEVWQIIMDLNKAMFGR